MIIDIYRDNVHELDYYENTSYDQYGITQIAEKEKDDETLLINDYEIDQSETDQGVNQLIGYKASPDYDFVVGVGDD